MKLLNIQFLKETIMKKVYLHPEMEIVEIKGQVLLAGSLSISETEVSADDVLAPEFGDDLVVFDE